MKNLGYFIKFFLVSILGWTGWHLFIKGKVLSGIMFLFTFGYFFVGWIFDICKTAYERVK